MQTSYSSVLNGLSPGKLVVDFAVPRVLVWWDLSTVLVVVELVHPGLWLTSLVGVQVSVVVVW